MMKSFKILFIVFLAFTTVFSQQQQTIYWPSLADSPWPTFRGDMQGTGRSQFVGPKTANVIWRADLTLGIIWGPSIGFDDILYFGTNSVDTSNHNKFYAYYPSGEPFWIYETDSFVPNWTKPIVTFDSTVYMGSNHGYLYAFTIDGQLKWKLQVEDGHRFNFAISKEGNIYVAAGISKVVSPAGEIILEKLILDIITDFSFSPSGDTIYYHTGVRGSGDENPSYLNAADLNLNHLWRYKFSESNYSAPLVDNQNNIYVYGADSSKPNDIGLYCLSANGTVRWKYAIDAYAVSYCAPTMDSMGNVIFFAYKNGNKIISVNYLGELNWEYPLENILDMISHGLVCDADGTIYCGTTDPGYFCAISSEGELLWKLLTEEYEFDASPAIGSDGTLYIGLNGSTLFSDHRQNLIAIKDDPTLILTDAPQPAEYNLYQNYPNPFNPQTVIKYHLPHEGMVSLKIYDTLGKELKTLVNEFQTQGTYNVKFEALNLPSGIYIYRLTAGTIQIVKKMMLIK
jgi:outer membrane protein assembly factor BamB